MNETENRQSMWCCALTSRYNYSLATCFLLLQRLDVCFGQVADINEGWTVFTEKFFGQRTLHKDCVVPQADGSVESIWGGGVMNWWLEIYKNERVGTNDRVHSHLRQTPAEGVGKRIRLWYYILLWIRTKGGLRTTKSQPIRSLFALYTSHAAKHSEGVWTRWSQL